MKSIEEVAAIVVDVAFGLHRDRVVNDHHNFAPSRASTSSAGSTKQLATCVAQASEFQRQYSLIVWQAWHVWHLRYAYARPRRKWLLTAGSCFAYAECMVECGESPGVGLASETGDSTLTPDPLGLPRGILAELDPTARKGSSI